MNKRLFILLLIFILGFIVRFWHVGSTPPGLNRDEASIGYTAHSLLLTGKDEYGVSWPISFKSFGDWKLPLYIYTDIPFIKFFGLTDISVRLPSVLFGSLTIIVTYFLTRELFKNAMIGVLPLLASFIFALSPWSIHLSRTASEANSGVFFTALGLLIFLKYSRNFLLKLLAIIFLVLPLYTYHGNHIFTLFLFAGLVIYFWRKHKTEKSFWVATAIFILLSIFIYSKTVFTADKTKISGLLVLGDPALVYEKITIDRLQHLSPSQIYSNLLHNKAILTAMSVIQNYAKSFSPEFLFITGGGNAQHNIPDFGNLYLWSAPFLLVGFSYLLAAKNNYKNLILWWLFISPIAASITKDAPHTSRMAPIMPLLEILTAYGFWRFLTIIRSKRKIFSVALQVFLEILFILNFIFWTDRYFIHFPLKRASFWGEGYKKLVSVLSTNNNFGVKGIVMSRPEYSPYIYFLFYNRIDPNYFQNKVVRYKETKEGFHHVTKFDKYSFRQIDWSDDLAIPDRLYIDWSDQIPKGATQSGVIITNDLMNKLIANNKDISEITLGDFVISQKIADIKLDNQESMFTLIRTAKMK